MVELKKDTTNRILGRKRHTCRICGTEGEFETYLVREMMQGTRNEFVYFACDRCQCLQIADVPDNLGDYYGKDYYSMQVTEDSNMKFDIPISHTMKVLDVGCGTGAWLLQKAMKGWGNLYGCDPFLEKDRRYGFRVTIRSCSIHEMEGDETFDVIRMSDSFEHVTDPLEVLKSARRLLKPDGTLYMTIPTYPNIAFERYGTHWYQLDAPRHIFLYSKQSLEWLAKASGLAISSVQYNSNKSQFIRSYFYQRGISFYEQTPKLIGQHFSPMDIIELDRESEACNEKEYGDHMKVYWRKSTFCVAEERKKVIFQRFPRKYARWHFPYPPVYREPDTDYICFTDDEKIHSSVWKVQVVDNLEQADLKPYLEKYAVKWELKPNQIQMGSMSEAYAAESLVTVPAFEDLPLIHFEPEKFVPTANEEGNYIYRKNPVYNKGKYNGRPLVLTIGVPVSNQIDTIDRCLFHIKPLLDGLDSELLVIDTGSTDGTVEVCRSYGAKVISHPWHDNMSAVRNEGIYHARGEWYMSIDDDEWFEDVEDILKFFKRGIYRNYDSATYIQRNYADSKGEVYGDNHTLRMARISPDLHFEGRIHDALVFYGRNRSYMLQSYAHHYGFVHDNAERMKEKFMRNASILLYDMYEYPEDLRYLFQLANEYRCIKYKDIAIKLFAQTIALSKEIGNEYRGRMSVVELLSALYDLNDRRLFQWAQYLESQFSLQVADQASIAWCQENLAFHLGKSVEKVVQYYERYRELLEQYQKDPRSSQLIVFNSLAMVEHDFYIMNAEAIAFCSYLKIKEEKKALKLLFHISLEVVKNHRITVLSAGLTAEKVVYEALCSKLTAMQWEEWSDAILDTFTFSLTKDSLYEQQAGRFPDILARFSVSAIISWIERSEKRQTGRIGEKLFKYAMECEIGNENPIQELCLCAWILKEEYVKRRNEPDSKEILYRYISVFGLFAERYYNLDCLIDVESHVVPPDICAIYRMAVVLADGTATSENIAVLKQALEIFPPFHEEIRIILMGLSRTEISRNN